MQQQVRRALRGVPPQGLVRLFEGMTDRPPPGDSVRVSDKSQLKWQLIEIGFQLVGGILCFTLLKRVMSHMDPMKQHKEGIQQSKTALSKRLRRPELAKMNISEYEKMMADEVLDADEIEGGFDSIGGLEQEKRDIYELVVLPLQRPDMFNQRGRLLASPKGILLYGSPGTGKTLLAKAIAKESGAAFLNLRASVLMNKYFGESNKIVAAVFSLAYKIAPCVIFIDEIDAFLRQRGGVDDSAWISLKAEFMTLWDGMLTESGKPVIVLGATNRPYDLDQAILRRLPRQFEIPMPAQADRVKILSLLLKRENVDESVSIEELARLTEGYSGSDLKEMCRAAVMMPLRDLMPYNSHGGSIATMNVDDLDLASARTVCLSDFHTAIQRVRPTGEAAADYREREGMGAANGYAFPQHMAGNAIMAILQSFLAQLAQNNGTAAQA